MFAWRRYVNMRDTDAENVNPYDMFDWVVERNPNFDFNQYLNFSDYVASLVAPSTWQPVSVLVLLFT